MSMKMPWGQLVDGCERCSGEMAIVNESMIPPCAHIQCLNCGHWTAWMGFIPMSVTQKMEQRRRVERSSS